MKNRTLLMMISLVLALATAGAAYVWLKTQDGGAVKPEEKVALWSAKTDIAAGLQITDKMIEKVMVPKDQLAPGIYTDSKDIVGSYAKETILKGEAFPVQRLYSETDRLLSMRLEPGYRAFSISMTRFSGVADLVKAGDRVDIFVYLKELQGAEGVDRPDIAQVILQDVEVLAVRQEIQKDSPPPKDVVDLYAVTLAVPVKAVEKLILGEETGILKMALRPFDEKITYTSYGVVWKELLLDPSMSLRDFETEYGVVKEVDVLAAAQPNPLPPEPTQASATEVAVTTEPGTVSPVVTPTVQPTTVQPTTGQLTTEAPKPIKKPSYTLYTVQSGDTLMSISRKFFNGSASYYDDIMRINGLSDQTIKPGQKLKIPLAGR